VGILQKHNMTHPLPTGKSGFISDEQPDQVSPSPMHREALCSDNDRLSPENMWKQAVEDNYPPAVLHRIVSVSPILPASYDIDLLTPTPFSCCTVL
jgi:hypothetical protein